MRDPTGSDFGEGTTHGVRGEQLGSRDGQPALHETVRLYLGYLLLAVICLAISLVAVPMRIMLPRELRKRLGRQLIAA